MHVGNVTCVACIFIVMSS